MTLITKPDFTYIWASGGAVVAPNDAKKQLGWIAEAPPFQYDNWLQNRQDQMLAHINQRGMCAWDGLTNYEAGGLSYVQGSDGKVYKSVAASGPATTTQDPTTDVTDTYWTVAFASTAQATETVQGIVELATTAEAQTGTDDIRAMTPLKVKQAIAQFGNDFINTTRIDVASASTVNLTTSAPNTRHINITGTTTINGFTVAVGQCYFVRFNASLTLTNSGSLVTQTGTNITTSAGDSCIIRATATNVVEILCYQTVRRAVQGGLISLSGTAVDITGIPEWVRRITIPVSGMSGNGSSLHVLQIGTSSGIENTGYLGSISGQGPGAVQVGMSSGFNLDAAVAAANIQGGVISLVNVGGNTWAMSGLISRSDTVFINTGSGSKLLSGVLDRVRLTSLNGTDSFDAGSISIIYEGW